MEISAPLVRPLLERDTSSSFGGQVTSGGGNARVWVTGELRLNWMGAAVIVSGRASSVPPNALQTLGGKLALSSS